MVLGGRLCYFEEYKLTKLMNVVINTDRIFESR